MVTGGGELRKEFQHGFGYRIGVRVVVFAVADAATGDVAVCDSLEW